MELAKVEASVKNQHSQLYQDADYYSTMKKLDYIRMVLTESKNNPHYSEGRCRLYYQGRKHTFTLVNHAVTQGRNTYRLTIDYIDLFKDKVRIIIEGSIEQILSLTQDCGQIYNIIPTGHRPNKVPYVHEYKIGTMLAQTVPLESVGGGKKSQAEEAFHDAYKRAEIALMDLRDAFNELVKNVSDK